MEQTVRKIFEPRLTKEGAGVLLHRVFGQEEEGTLDPFLLFDDFGSGDPADYLAGFPHHPHRGMETVTYVIRGRVRHSDSLGNTGVIEDGGVQWMTAGSGIMHEEMPEQYAGDARAFQLWVNLPKKHKLTQPRYQNFSARSIPLCADDAGTVRVIAGSYNGANGPVDRLMTEVAYFDVTLLPERTRTFNVPLGQTAFLYVFEGAVSIAGEAYPARRALVLKDGETVTVQGSTAGARFLFIAGRPLGEPIAWYGPIVMNTRGEIAEALQELRSGDFVKECPKTA